MKFNHFHSENVKKSHFWNVWFECIILKVGRVSTDRPDGGRKKARSVSLFRVRTLRFPMYNPGTKFYPRTVNEVRSKPDETDRFPWTVTFWTAFKGTFWRTRFELFVKNFGKVLWFSRILQWLWRIPRKIVIFIRRNFRPWFQKFLGIRTKEKFL